MIDEYLRDVAGAVRAAQCTPYKPDPLRYVIDAFLACTAPLVAAGLPLEQAAFVGNVAGGLKTGILGHREHVTRQDLVKNIEWLLK